MSLRRSNRARAQSNSSLYVPSVSTQPAVRLMQPSPTISRTRSARALTQPTPLRPPIIGVAQNDEASTSSSLPINNNNIHNNENVVCPLCALVVQDGGNGLMCSRCDTWFHPECLYLTEEEFVRLSQSSESWFCDHCKSVVSNRIKWGTFEGEENILREIRAAYHEITSWKKNLFLLPRGKAATDFIKEMTRLINLFVNRSGNALLYLYCMCLCLLCFRSQANG